MALGRDDSNRQVQVREAFSSVVLDRLFTLLVKGCGLFVLVVIVAIMVSLWLGAWPAFDRFGLGFFLSQDWNPVTEKFGALVSIYGTLVTSLIAMMIGVPVSFGIAIFITELCPAWLKRPVSTAIELLAAIPSIIYGM